MLMGLIIGSTLLYVGVVVSLSIGRKYAHTGPYAGKGSA